MVSFKNYLVLLALPLFTQAQTWNAVSSPTTRTLRAVAFTDAHTGYIAGDSGALYKTSDGGESWISSSAAGKTTLYGLNFVSATSGYAVGDKGTVLHTTDAGATWTAQTSSSTKTLSSVSFSNASNGWVTEDAGKLIKTTNGGASWSAVSAVTATPVSRVVAVPGLVYAIGPGDVYSRGLRSTNGGSTWIKDSTGYSRVGGLCFVDSLTGYLVTNLGGSHISRTTDGAQTWLEEYAPTTQGGNGLACVNAATAYIAGQGIVMRRASNAWSAQTAGADLNITLYAVAAATPSSLFAVGSGGNIFQSTQAPSSIRGIANARGTVLFKNEVRYALDKKGAVEARLFDVRGIELWRSTEVQEAGDHTLALPSKAFAPGVLWISLRVDGVSVLREALIP